MVRLGLQSDGNGAALATLGYKVNAPYDTTMFLGSGFLCGITNTPFAGTWTISLTNDTDFVLTAPNGTTARGSMPGADTSFFSSQVHFYLGVNPSGGRNIGKFITVSDVSIVVTNAGTTIHSDFTTGAPLDGATWAVLADDPASLIMMPSRSVYRVEWHNAVGAGVGPNSLQFTNTLGGSTSWSTVTPGVLLGNSTNVVLITDALATNSAGFFRVSVPYSP